MDEALLSKLRAYAPRFWARVERLTTDECWSWQGRTQIDGYGQFYLPGSGSARAHRAAWALTYGAIPAGLFVCHHCDNPVCCNPSHLFLGTALDNNRDRDQKGRAGPHIWHGKTEKFPRGIDNFTSKMTEEIVAELRRSAETNEVIGKRLGLSTSAVHRARCGQTWGWVKDPPPWPRQERRHIPPKIWLWRNGDHYWAFDNKYPCDENGDPMTLGEPVGFAVFKPSRSSGR
jgi:hypothetical protein